MPCLGLALPGWNCHSRHSIVFPWRGCLVGVSGAHGAGQTPCRVGAVNDHGKYRNCCSPRRRDGTRSRCWAWWPVSCAAVAASIPSGTVVGLTWRLTVPVVVVRRFQVLKVFRRFGNVTKVEFLWHRDGPRRGQPRGYCFVEFEKHEVRGEGVAAASCCTRERALLSLLLHLEHCASSVLPTRTRRVAPPSRRLCILLA